MVEPNEPQRSRRWTADGRPRLWWHRLPGMDFVPPIYSNLSGAEWELVRQWYQETDRAGLIGECAVPLMSLLQGLVMGNRIARIVQLGTCSGYSALLLGFMLRRMNARNGLLTLEIDPELCALSQSWLARAGLTNHVKVAESNSLDPASVAAARNYLGDEPELIILDSSHEYEPTLRELDLWYGALRVGGLLVLHDVSEFAAGFDVTGKGGVLRAFAEWRQKSPQAETFCLNAAARSMEGPRPLYKDACGVGLIHKPGIPPN
jgi:predicted O-methyltransferase YrrM